MRHSRAAHASRKARRPRKHRGDPRDAQRGRRVDVLVRGDVARAEAALRAVPGVARAARTGTDPPTDVESIRASFSPELERLDRDRAIERCVEALVGAGIGVRDVRATGGSLEEVFAALTGETKREGKSLDGERPPRDEATA